YQSGRISWFATGQKELPSPGNPSTLTFFKSHFFRWQREYFAINCIKPGKADDCSVAFATYSDVLKRYSVTFVPVKNTSKLCSILRRDLPRLEEPISILFFPRLPIGRFKPIHCLL